MKEYNLYTVPSLRRVRLAALVGLITVMLVVWAFLASYGRALAAPAGAPSAQEPVVPDAGGASDIRVFLPTVFQRQPMYSRLGYGALSDLPYPSVSDLQAGWYVNWKVNPAPNRPNGIEYAQTIRIHQRTVCQLPDRVQCPYVVPYAYDFAPDADTIRLAARTNPGSMWFIGNEMERRDWGPEPHQKQDEMLPELYAVAYHELYNLIKSEDPKAQVAIGGVIQPTPLRLQYLTRVWNTYLDRYGQPMPVDIWNVHNFIIREVRDEWGADIPAGIDAAVGEYANDATTHINMGIFDQQIRAFRQWMKDRGQQEKPLVINEYGVLLPNTVFKYPEEDSAVVQDFMLSTFDYFLNTKDCSLGYAADECRLVQRWAWYSLDDDRTGFNRHAYLLDPDTDQLTPAGLAFRNFGQANSVELSRILP